MSSITIFIMTNGRNTLEETLTSVCIQTYENIKVIISDNSNSEYIRNLAIKYSVDYVGHVNNKNLADNINSCLDILDTDYFCLMHDDDVMHKDFVKENIKSLKSNDASFSFCTTTIFYNEYNQKNFKSTNEKQSNKNFLLKPGKQSFKKILLNDYTIFMPSVVYNSTIRNDVYFTDSLIAMGDLKKWLYLITKYSCVYVDKSLFYYRVWENNHSNEIAYKGYFLSETFSILKWVKKLGYFSNNEYKIIKLKCLLSQTKILCWAFIKSNKIQLNDDASKIVKNSIVLRLCLSMLSSYLIRKFIYKFYLFYK